MEIRKATMADLKAIAAVEAACFPPAEAATEEVLRERLQAYADHFWLLFASGELIGFVNGMVTGEKDLRDEMYGNAAFHEESGAWQMIFGVDTVPGWRRRGCASLLLSQVIREAREQGRKGLVLTCKREKIPFYAKFGFREEGVSASVHGNAVWYQMRLTF